MRGFSYRDQRGDVALKISSESGELDFDARTADSQWLNGWSPQSRLRSVFKLKQWNHVVVTRRSDTYAMWMNGVKVASEVSPADISDADDTNPFVVGAMTDDKGVHSMFRGALDEFRIFHRCLSDAEIANLYRGGADNEGSDARPPADSGLVASYDFQGATAPATPSAEHANLPPDGEKTPESQADGERKRRPLLELPRRPP